MSCVAKVLVPAAESLIEAHLIVRADLSSSSVDLLDVRGSVEFRSSKGYGPCCKRKGKRARPRRLKSCKHNKICKPQGT